MRVLSLMLFCCVGDAFVLQQAAPRALLAPHRHSSAAQMLLPMQFLPTVALAEAANPGSVDAPIGIIVAGAVLATLTAGLPVCATAIAVFITPLALTLVPCSHATAFL